MYPDTGLNCILLHSVFCVFNLYILLLTMQGACAMQDSVQWRMMHKEEVPLCYVYKCPIEIVWTTPPNLPTLDTHDECVKKKSQTLHSMCF